MIDFGRMIGGSAIDPTVARIHTPRPASPAEATAPAGAGFGTDAADVDFSAAAPAPQAEAAPAAPAPTEAPAKPAPSRSYEMQYDPETGGLTFGTPGTRPATEEHDGFMVAGAAPSRSLPSSALNVGSVSSSGPIAMIEDPVAPEIDFPGLTLNGPSTASEGFFSLGGRRLA